MGVVTWAYYSTQWMGEAPETDFPRLDLLAEDAIANITRQVNYAALTAAQQTLYQKAICAQIDYLNYFGAQTAYAGYNGAGFTVGKVSINNTDGDNSAKTRAQMSISPAAKSYLEAAGLMGRGVAVPQPRGWIGWWW